jgi:hypothetical protein
MTGKRAARTAGPLQGAVVNFFKSRADDGFMRLCVYARAGVAAQSCGPPRGPAIGPRRCALDHCARCRADTAATGSRAAIRRPRIVAEGPYRGRWCRRHHPYPTPDFTPCAPSPSRLRIVERCPFSLYLPANAGGPYRIYPRPIGPPGPRLLPFATPHPTTHGGWAIIMTSEDATRWLWPS